MVVFSLKLADEYQQFGVRNNVIDMLVHNNERVRTQAMKTLIRLADEKTPMILLGYFRKEGLINQSMILDALTVLATGKERDCLVRILNHENNIIKLKAAIVLANCCSDGMDLLEKRALAEPEPFERILRHVKTVK